MKRRVLLQIDAQWIESTYCDQCERMARIGWADRADVRIVEVLAEDAGGPCDGCDDAFEAVAEGGRA